MNAKVLVTVTLRNRESRKHGSRDEVHEGRGRTRNRTRSIALAVLAPVVATGLLVNGAVASADSTSQTVSAYANIFGAGYPTAQDPGGGGAGSLPPVWRLPPGSERVVTFPRITGKVTPISGERALNGPEGDRVGPTDIDSWRGISGIIDRGNGMFLVGVFLSDAEPSMPAPPRLDFTDKEQFTVLAPRLGQTFFIGDGQGRSYNAPEGATRLFLGFADGALYQGPPGWYGNNAGSLEVEVAGAIDVPAADTTPPTLSGAKNKSVRATRGAKRLRVRYTVRAQDAIDGSVPVTCTPRSGSFFKLGRTKVECSATDSSGNAAKARFTVTVKRARA